MHFDIDYVISKSKWEVLSGHMILTSYVNRVNAIIL
jgi:hypothetical protein